MRYRSRTIDVTKGILTIGMVLAHVIQLLGDGRSWTLKYISLYTNLVSFSGFLFCFGFASWHAYISREPKPLRSILKTSCKCYLAFIVSGVAYRLLIESRPLTIDLVVRIAEARDLPGYSEFLISFAIIPLLGLVITKPLHVVTRNKWGIIAASLACLSLTYIHYPFLHHGWLCLFFGRYGTASFPVVQYFPLFLCGLFVARHALTPGVSWLWTGGCIVVGFSALLASGVQTSRFPPAASWILASAGMVGIYAACAQGIVSFFPGGVTHYLGGVGRNVLSYLLLSNGLIFSIQHWRGRLHGTAKLIGCFLILMVVLFFLHWVVGIFRRDGAWYSAQTENE